MSNELVTTKLSLEEQLQIAKILFASKRFPSESDATQVAMKIIAGQELGIPPVRSVTDIHIVNGKVALGAGIISSKIKSSGKYDYRIVKLDNSGCKLEFFENGRSVGFSEFTINDAQQAGLVNKDVWKKFPRNMLFSRALTNGQRWFCSDVLNGPAYTPEELNDNVGDEVVVINEDNDIIDVDSYSLDEIPESKLAFLQKMAIKFDEPETKIRTKLRDLGYNNYDPKKYNEMVENLENIYKDEK